MALTISVMSADLCDVCRIPGGVSRDPWDVRHPYNVKKASLGCQQASWDVKHPVVSNSYVTLSGISGTAGESC